MKANFEKIHCCFKAAFIILLNARGFLASQYNIDEVFYNYLF